MITHFLRENTARQRLSKAVANGHTKRINRWERILKTEADAKDALRREEHAREQRTGYRKEFVGTPEMITKGWTRHGITKFLGEPDKVWESRYAKGHLYKVDRIGAAWPHFTAWRDKRGSKVTAHQRRFSTFGRNYTNWRQALPQACKFLFDLNRYTKHASCSDANRDDIYSLKQQMVEALYNSGFAVEVYRHHITLAAKECFGCDGTGVDWSGDDCNRCDGTGEYLPKKTLRFVCFRFEIEGQKYCWHQPKELVKFPFSTTKDGSEPLAPAEEEDKPITLSARKFAEAKDLVRWVLLHYTTESAATNN